MFPLWLSYRRGGPSDPFARGDDLNVPVVVVVLAGPEPIHPGSRIGQPVHQDRPREAGQRPVAPVWVPRRRCRTTSSACRKWIPIMTTYSRRAVARNSSLRACARGLPRGEAGGVPWEVAGGLFVVAATPTVRTVAARRVKPWWCPVWSAAWWSGPVADHPPRPFYGRRATAA